jgi:ectoine hydroxylase-related dioxygenase (phytanoyl-CoA dioxygenase family)
LHWPSKYAPELADTLHRRNALAIARQLLGPEAEPQFEHMILKPGHYGAPTPWHQDEAYWDEGLEYNALSIWMPLEDATLENGCMHFVPGTNNAGVMSHHSISNDPRIHGLEIDAIDVSGEVACPIPAGGATVHTSRTVHYAGPNRTPSPRRAYILLFQTPPKKLAQPRNFYWMREKETPRERRLREAKSEQR